jgi:hypothetical protein
MTTQKLNADTIKMLIGRTIKEASENWILLDNGVHFYLDDSEIDALNS